MNILQIDHPTESEALSKLNCIARFFLREIFKFLKRSILKVRPFASLNKIDFILVFFSIQMIRRLKREALKKITGEGNSVNIESGLESISFLAHRLSHQFTNTLPEKKIIRIFLKCTV